MTLNLKGPAINPHYSSQITYFSSFQLDPMYCCSLFEAPSVNDPRKYLLHATLRCREERYPCTQVSCTKNLPLGVYMHACLRESRTSLT